MTTQEAHDAFKDTLKNSDLDRLLSGQIVARRQALEIDHQHLREVLQRQAGWLEDADHLTVSHVVLQSER